MNVAIVHGGAVGVWEEAKRALALVESVGFQPVMIALNEAGIYLETLDHWGTLHPDKLPGWEKERREQGHAAGYERWSVSPSHHTDRTVRTWRGGSSGLHGADIAVNGLGIGPVILCGVPMDNRDNHFRGNPWGKYRVHLPGWEKRAVRPILAVHVRSMAGFHPTTGEPAWTTSMFGAPDAAWLESFASAAA